MGFLSDKELRKLVLREIERIDDWGTLLDLYYITLKHRGKSYIDVRREWLKPENNNKGERDNE
jgi:hypothetical protein